MIPDSSVNTSIAMATYNGEEFLREQLDSIRKQIVQPDELIVSDDNSTDETVRILTEFKNSVNFPVYIIQNSKRVGHSQNFERALQHTRNQIVFLCDQDDYWHEDKISTILRALSEQKAQVIIHDLNFCDAHLNRIGQTKIQRMKGTLNLDKSYVTGMATAVRQEFLQMCLPIPKLVSHDTWINRCASFLDSKVILEVPLAEYRRHENSATAMLNINSAQFVAPENFLYQRPKLINRLIKKTKVELGIDPLISKWAHSKALELSKCNYVEQLHFEESLKALDSRIKFLSERKAIIEAPRLKRIKLAVQHFKKGGYINLHGYFSFLKDVLGP